MKIKHPNCTHEEDDKGDLQITIRGQVVRSYCLECLIDILDKAYQHNANQSSGSQPIDKSDYDRAMGVVK
jgi:hypothetical protein